MSNIFAYFREMEGIHLPARTWYNGRASLSFIQHHFFLAVARASLIEDHGLADSSSWGAEVC